MSLMATSLFKLSTFLAPIWDFPTFPASIWDFPTFPGIYPLQLNYQIYYINFQNKALLFIKLFSFISFVIFICIFVFFSLGRSLFLYRPAFTFIHLPFYFLWQFIFYGRQGRTQAGTKWLVWSEKMGVSGPGFYCGYRVGLGLHLGMPCRCQGRCKLF